MSFYDLPRGWQHQVTRENFALWSLDGEAMKQTLDSGSPVELIDDKLRVRSKLWVREEFEKLATLAIEAKINERPGYGSWDATEAIADYLLGLQPQNVVNYIRWMVEVDWMLGLGSKASWLERLRPVRRKRA
ncbi:MAG: hypothetical protein KAV87_44730 [Desulfobacteraceae bacterium]|nr:hypothetical protein [Desulfobacteraceae bacterium]